MSPLEQKILELIESAQQAVVGVAPQAWALLVVLKRWESIISIVGGIGAGVVIWLVARQLPQIIKKCASAVDTDFEIPYMLLAIFCGIGIVLLAIFGAIELLDLGNWLGIVRPDLAVLRDILNKVTK